MSLHVPSATVGRWLPSWLPNWLPVRRDAAAAFPTVLHITHYKAGSQWVYWILFRLFGKRVVKPLPEVGHVYGGPLVAGKVYPTVYATRGQLQGVSIPEYAARFVVIRDLRDTLVSWYFSAKQTHSEEGHRHVASSRKILNDRDMEAGLIWAVDEIMPGIAAIQESWLGGAEPLLKYEDLLNADERLLCELFVERLKLPVSRRRIGRAVREMRFEKLTGGRGRGKEDLNSHLRRGVAGDWRNHFTPRVKERVKERFGDLLVRTGYESSRDW
jgi:lipopolysaccharide transport system ATP-binding protein